MAIVPAIPIVEAIGEAAMAAWRAYRAYQAAKALADAISQAQQQASDDAKPKDTTVPQAQTTSDTAVDSNCKDCKEKDPDKCKEIRNGIRRKLYGAKKPRGIGGIASDPAQSHAKGLVQSICEFIHDAGAALVSHEESINNLLRGLENEFKKLNKYNCRIPSDLAEEAGKYTKEAQSRFNTRKMTQKIANFQDFCYNQANALNQTVGVFE